MQGANFGYGIGPASTLGPRPGPRPPPCTGTDSMTWTGPGDLTLPACRGGLPGPRQPESRRDWRIAVETAGLRDRIGWRIRLVEGEPVVPGPRRLAAKSVLQVHWPSVPQAHGPSVPRLTGRQFPGPTGRQFPRLTGHQIPRARGQSVPRAHGPSVCRAHGPGYVLSVPLAHGPSDFKLSTTSQRLTGLG